MRFFKRTDIIIVSSILLISLAIWVFYGLFYADTPVMAEIYYESRLVERVDLGKNEDRVFTIRKTSMSYFVFFGTAAFVLKNPIAGTGYVSGREA